LAQPRRHSRSICRAGSVIDNIGLWPIPAPRIIIDDGIGALTPQLFHARSDCREIISSTGSRRHPPNFLCKFLGGSMENYDQAGKTNGLPIGPYSCI
jgi:hypothetical protein